MILNQSPPEPRVLNAKISLRTQAIILKALEKAAEERYANRILSTKTSGRVGQDDVSIQVEKIEQIRVLEDGLRSWM